jgi:hypothetical protein
MKKKQKMMELKIVTFLVCSGRKMNHVRVEETDAGEGHSVVVVVFAPVVVKKERNSGGISSRDRRGSSLSYSKVRRLCKKGEEIFFTQVSNVGIFNRRNECKFCREGLLYKELACVCEWHRRG